MIQDGKGALIDPMVKGLIDHKNVGALTSEFMAEATPFIRKDTIHRVLACVNGSHGDKCRSRNSIILVVMYKMFFENMHFPTGDWADSLAKKLKETYKNLLPTVMNRDDPVSMLRNVGIPVGLFGFVTAVRRQNIPPFVFRFA